MKAQLRIGQALLLVLLLALSACTSTPPARPKLVNHAFSFNGKAYSDNWADTVDLLEYSYGDQYRMVRDKVEPPKERLGPSSGVNGAIPVGEFLYVRWRIRSTGEVLDDRVDLRPLLPENMSNHRLTFVIDGRQLYVYLVTPTPKHENDPPILRTTKSRYYVTYEIHPTNTYAKR